MTNLILKVGLTFFLVKKVSKGLEAVGLSDSLDLNKATLGDIISDLTVLQLKAIKYSSAMSSCISEMM